MAELIAHLGEVEERRLHLAAACSSMFAYCLELGMTEGEAYRRIEVARLARRYPALFPLLANGQLSISVVALLKHHLSEENHVELLAAVIGKSVAQTRELMAARFPQPDVPSSVRKLPERRTMTEPSLALSTPPESSASGTEPSTGVTEPRFAADVTEPRADVTEPRADVTELRADVTELRTGEAEPCSTANAMRLTEVPASAAPADVARKEGSMSSLHRSTRPALPRRKLRRPPTRSARHDRVRSTRSARRHRLHHPASSRSPPNATRSNSRRAPGWHVSSSWPGT